MGLLTLYNASLVSLNILDPDLVTVYPSTVTGTPTPTANPGGPAVNFNPIYDAGNTYLDNLPSLATTGLNNTLDITNLDVENPGVQGGPLSDITTVYPALATGTPTPTANPGGPPTNFSQPYLPTNTYLNSNPIQGITSGKLDDSLPITNLDVENPGVQGGPLNDTITSYPSLATGTPTSTANPGGPPRRFVQPYLPFHTYLNSNPIQGVGSGKLDDSLPITNLDVEDPGVQGGPLNDITTVYPVLTTGTPTPIANPGGAPQRFVQPYLPSNTYLNTNPIQGIGSGKLDDTLNITNLDVENPGVQGGPLNDTITVYPVLTTGTPTTTANPGGAPQRFVQPYKPSPGNTYLDTNPIQGVGSGKLDNTLDITNLDVENPGVNGGPINDTTTLYPPSVTGTPSTTANPGAPPKQFIQSYLPSNTYLDASYNVLPNNTILSSSLNITNLDVEDPGVNGGIPYKSLNDPTIYPANTNHTSAIRGYFAVPSSASLKFEQIFNPKNTYSDFINPYTL